MKLVIENIGKIKKAEFDFRGITVIAEIGRAHV